MKYPRTKYAFTFLITSSLPSPFSPWVSTLHSSSPVKGLQKKINVNADINVTSSQFEFRFNAQDSPVIEVFAALGRGWKGKSIDVIVRNPQPLRQQMRDYTAKNPSPCWRVDERKGGTPEVGPHWAVLHRPWPALKSASHIIIIHFLFSTNIEDAGKFQQISNHKKI